MRILHMSEELFYASFVVTYFLHTLKKLAHCVQRDQMNVVSQGVKCKYWT